MSAAGPSTDLVELAVMYGIVPAFEAVDGTTQRAGVDTLRSVLGALGAPVISEREVRALIAARRDEVERRVIEPVLTARGTRTEPIAIRLPAGVEPQDCTVALELEGGETLRRPLADLFESARRRGARAEGLVDLRAAGWPAIEPGYHALALEAPGLDARALYVVAPRCPIAPRTWGAFMPLYAVRSTTDWGIGSYSDLGDLSRWIEQLGGGFVGTLPLYPLSDQRPMDPSPYLPLSRLAYNELYIDPAQVPELDECPDARRVLDSTEMARQLAALRTRPLVDYDEVARLKRSVLELLATTLTANHSARSGALRDFGAAHPELVAYARYRARREGADSASYHLYTQWLAATQLSDAATAGAPLYGDLPIGVRSDGFDTEWAPDSFAIGVSGGAPPDDFFADGQNWGFRPLHPERLRHDGYRYLVASVRRACRHAGFLRIDHVPGLHRLFWIPDGMEGSEGVYVRYRSHEWRAIICLEAARSGAVVVGEDLGTVPAAVRTDMATDGMARSWVMQFESSAAEPLPEPPTDVLASWSTHDLTRFETYFTGADLTPTDHSQQAERAAWREALVSRLPAGADAPDVAFRGCLEHLAASPAALVMVDIEELWGERMAQNQPGTGPEAANWRRRAPQGLDELRADRDRGAFLAHLSTLRHSQTAGVAVQSAP